MLYIQIFCEWNTNQGCIYFVSHKYVSQCVCHIYKYKTDDIDSVFVLLTYHCPVGILISI